MTSSNHTTIRTPHSRYGLIDITSRVLALMTPQRRSLKFSVCMSCIAAAFSLLPYAILGWLVICALPMYSGQELTLPWAVVVIMGALIGEKIAFGLATHTAHLAAFAAQQSLRLLLAKHLEMVHLGFCENQSKGQMRTLFIDDIETLEDGMAHLITEVSAAVLIPMVVLVGIAVLDWKLAVLCFVPMGLGLLQLRKMLREGREATFEYLSINAEVASRTAQYTDGLSTYRAFDQAGQAVQRPKDVFRRMSEFSNEWLKRAVIPGTTSQILLTTPLILVGPVGALLVATGLTTLNSWIIAVSLTFGFGDLFSAVHGISHRVLHQGQLLDRVDALLDQPEMPIMQPTKTPENNAIQMRNVSFAYGQDTVLSGINVAFEPGAFVALVGPSGSGKSTVARLLARFEDPTVGSITLGGVDLRQIESEDLYARIGFVFQDVFLFEGTVAENIRLGKPNATMDEIKQAAKLAQAHKFVESLPGAYDSVIAEGGAGLSGGQRQRLSIARAILKDAPVLLLDEATSFADPESEDEIQKGISNLAVGRTVVVIAHRLHTIVHADQILMLDDGKVVEQGIHHELLSLGGRYAKQWAAMMQLEAQV